MIRLAEARASGPTLLWAVGTLASASEGGAVPDPGLREALLRRLDAPPWPMTGTTERVVARDGPTGDPFRLRALLAEGPGAPVLLVAPRRWGPRRLVPAPVVEGSPVGLLLATRASHLPPAPAPAPSDLVVRGPEAAPPGAPWVVAAMAKDVFLRPTDGWADTLNRAGCPTLDLRADRARRSDLAAALGKGPGVVLYAGHGRNRGWGGYQGLRLPHLVAAGSEEPGSEAPGPEAAAPRPAGLVIAFACDTLKRSRNRTPFGIGLVEAGCTRAYLGAVGSLRTSDAEALAEVVVHLLAHGRHTAVASLLQGIEGAVGATGPARRAWQSFRLIGDPLAPLTPPTSTG